jgi:hypothetical protein
MKGQANRRQLPGMIMYETALKNYSDYSPNYRNYACPYSSMTRRGSV